MKFKLHSKFKPAGDQPKAINNLYQNFKNGEKAQTLLGVTGSGKTFTMANLIKKLNLPTLIISHNKTLAAQLFREFKEFFPENAVEYFVSYYDYYQPEAYVVKRDLYIEKDAAINDKIERLRHRATHSLLSRKDVIIVSSVSCIYGLGSPINYFTMRIEVKKGDILERNKFLEHLISINFQRNDYDFFPGTFRVRGDRIELIPIYSEKALRITFFDDEVEDITIFDPLTGNTDQKLENVYIYPATHYAADKPTLEKAVNLIEKELKERIDFYNAHNRLIEARRIAERTRYDIEMISEMGYCKGIENYSRYLDGRKQGEAPFSLIDYFPKDFLIIIDESHISIPQIRGMYSGDKARKSSLIEYGFRLPSAFDNRPLCFDEFERKVDRILYVSATPAEYELKKCSGKIIEQVVRPTGLVDPEIEVRKTLHQIDDIQIEISKRIIKKERVLITTLTKRMAEELSSFLEEHDFKVKYLHSEIDTIERIEIIRGLRMGEFDILVGINLLREGLDLPEVSLVIILDADKEGFLRSTRSLIQTFGRCARNVNGKVLLYADKMTDSMKKAISETNRRRELQIEYNKINGIIPKTIIKKISEGIDPDNRKASSIIKGIDSASLEDVIAGLKIEMEKAANNLKFEKAAEIRDEIFLLEKELKKI